MHAFDADLGDTGSGLTDRMVVAALVGGLFLLAIAGFAA